MGQIEVITEQARWDEIAAQLASATELAVDTESNSLHAYRERICLIQIGTLHEAFILDPLSVSDLSSLGDLLANPSITTDLHGADYDLRCFDRDYGFNIASLFDTQIAARFLGSTTPNLASVLETFSGVTIAKSRRLQRSNWARRPLDSESIEYAASDVLHLVELSRMLRLKLTELGRLEWVEEECQRLEQVRYNYPGPMESAFFQVKGSDRLTPRELTVFKELYLWRDGKAEQIDQPVFRVLPNEDLIKAAQETVECSAEGNELEEALVDRVPALRPHLSDGSRAKVMSAIHQGMQGRLIYRPETPRRPNPWTPESRERLQSLKQHRTSLGSELNLDPALVWPATSLERIALNPDAWREEIMGDITEDVRSWQRREFAQHFMDVLGVGL